MYTVLIKNSYQISRTIESNMLDMDGYKYLADVVFLIAHIKDFLTLTCINVQNI